MPTATVTIPDKSKLAKKLKTDNVPAELHEIIRLQYLEVRKAADRHLITHNLYLEAYKKYGNNKIYVLRDRETKEITACAVVKQDKNTTEDGRSISTCTIEEVLSFRRGAGKEILQYITATQLINHQQGDARIYIEAVNGAINIYENIGFEKLRDGDGDGYESDYDAELEAMEPTNNKFGFGQTTHMCLDLDHDNIPPAAKSFTPDIKSEFLGNIKSAGRSQESTELKTKLYTEYEKAMKEYRNAQTKYITLLEHATNKEVQLELPRYVESLKSAGHTDMQILKHVNRNLTLPKQPVSTPTKMMTKKLKERNNRRACVAGSCDTLFLTPTKDLSVLSVSTPPNPNPNPQQG